MYCRKPLMCPGSLALSSTSKQSLGEVGYGGFDDLGLFVGVVGALVHGIHQIERLRQVVAHGSEDAFFAKQPGEMLVLMLVLFPITGGEGGFAHAALAVDEGDQ
jgi:hypothetical protein